MPLEDATFPLSPARGDVRMHGDGTLWVCVAPITDGGTFGPLQAAVWRQVAGPRTGGFTLLPTPERVYDSRPGTQPAQGPKTKFPAGNVARTVFIKGNNGSAVPEQAVGALVTVLLVEAANGNGNFTIWADNKAKPLSNTLVWGGNAGRFTTLAVTSVDSLSRVKIDASLSTHVILDVVGYYR